MQADFQKYVKFIFRKLIKKKRHAILKFNIFYDIRFFVLFVGTISRIFHNISLLNIYVCKIKRVSVPALRSLTLL